MAISKEAQLYRLANKLGELEKLSYSGEISLRVEHGNIVHLSTAHIESPENVVKHLAPLMENNFYGKFQLQMENGKIVGMVQTDDEKIHT